ncbi:hypothetical protein GE061_012359 [Apolygus lucorum]|uniref:Uncharacterized protein n=1 Tax=Apolygus lucorum TaxID=248454 RepID=A0A8S9XSA4_APOLU|nr:hypothetical protein GE061_012359 [Apolygus lucorum]
MSEGEVGYLFTSNSYSSGEIVERRKPSTVINFGRQGSKDGGSCSGEGVGLDAAEECTIVDDLDSCADDTSRLNEELSSTTESTTSETSQKSSLNAVL